MECHLCISITQHWHVVWKKTTRGLSKKIETSSKINKPSFPHPNLISFTIVRKENRNLRKIPTPQLVKYKYYKKILHIPQCWYHHQSHARFRQADNKSTAAYTVEEASKVFFTTTVQGSCWVFSTATFFPVQILLIWTVGQCSRFVDSERLLTANVCWQQPLPKATVHWARFGSSSHTGGTVQGRALLRSILILCQGVNCV